KRRSVRRRSGAKPCLWRMPPALANDGFTPAASASSRHFDTLRASSLMPVHPSVECPSHGTVPPAECLAAFLRANLVYGGAGRREGHAVGLARLLAGHLAVEHVGEDEVGVTVERVAVAGAARDVLPELVPGMEHDHLLRRQSLARSAP